MKVMGMDIGENGCTYRAQQELALVCQRSQS